MQTIFLLVICMKAVATPVTTESFCSLDREIAGLMDAWTCLRGSDTGRGLLSAQMAILRAEAALSSALNCGRDNLPEEVDLYWQMYMKASADCIFSCREAFREPDAEDLAEFLTASFTRWETSGEEFLNSVQSTR